MNWKTMLTMGVGLLLLCGVCHAAEKTPFRHVDYFYFSIKNSWSVEKMGDVLEKIHTESGVPKSRIFVGLPIYGAVDARAHGHEGGIAYRSMIEKGADAGKNQWKGPDTGKVYHYSGVPLIREKTRYLIDNGYAGVFTFEISLDVPYESKDSILRAIDEVVSEGRRDGGTAER